MCGCVALSCLHSFHARVLDGSWHLVAPEIRVLVCECFRVFFRISVVCFSIKLFHWIRSEPTQSNRRTKNWTRFDIHRLKRRACALRNADAQFIIAMLVPVPPAFAPVVPFERNNIGLSKVICATTDNIIHRILLHLLSHRRHRTWITSRNETGFSFFYHFFFESCNLLHQMIPMEFHAPKQRHCISNLCSVLLLPIYWLICRKKVLNRIVRVRCFWQCSSISTKIGGYVWKQEPCLNMIKFFINWIRWHENHSSNLETLLGRICVTTSVYNDQLNSISKP